MVTKTRTVETTETYRVCDECGAPALYRCSHCNKDLCGKHIAASFRKPIIRVGYHYQQYGTISAYLCSGCAQIGATLGEFLRLLDRMIKFTRPPKGL